MTTYKLKNTGEIKSSHDIKIKIRKNNTIVIREYERSIVTRETTELNDLEIENKITELKEYLSDYTNFTLNSNYQLNKLNKTLTKLENIKNDKKQYIKEKNEELQEIRYDSVARTRDLLIDYTSQNYTQWNTFITLTFKENITSPTEANQLFENYITQVKRYLKKENIELYYIGVPEFQKRGAYHYHILTNIKTNTLLIPKQELKITYSRGKETKLEYYDLKYWNYGYSSAFDLKNGINDQFNVALYILKYLYKDIDKRMFGKKKILKSNNLEKPNVLKLQKENRIYNMALAYIKEKGHLEYHYRPQNLDDNVIPFEENGYTLSLEDYNMFKEILESLNI